MWNRRPEEELPRSFSSPVTGGVPARVILSPVEVNKEVTPVFNTPMGNTDMETSGTGSAVIGKAVKIVGEIYSNENLLIEGFVQGTVEAVDQKLTVGPDGTLHASVQVRELVVEGTVQGDVEASERVEIRKDAKLVGDLRAARVIIEDGAYFKGCVDIVRPEPAVMHPEPARLGAIPASPAAEFEPAFELMLSGSN